MLHWKTKQEKHIETDRNVCDRLDFGWEVPGNVGKNTKTGKMAQWIVVCSIHWASMSFSSYLTSGSKASLLLIVH